MSLSPNGAGGQRVMLGWGVTRVTVEEVYTVYTIVKMVVPNNQPPTKYLHI
jgi:hypothetical protein